MNYFAHGRHYIDRPYFLAGTIVPDLLGVVDRRIRVTLASASANAASEDPGVADVAQGVVQHLRDDDWFHQTRAFAELNLEFTATIRDALPGDDSFRPSVVAHILVEVLLDASLIAEAPAVLDAYYEAVDGVDFVVVAGAVNRMANRPTDQFPDALRRFCNARFLCDYGEDAKLLMRLNNVMRRVRLPPLPQSLCEVFPDARRQVDDRRDELLAGELSAGEST